MAAPALTNPDRVVYGNMGVTKRDVVEFYRNAARYLVPHLKAHPVTLKRYPDQTHGTFFWEKDAPAFTPSWVKTFGVWRRSGEAQIHYILVNDARTLEWAASVGTLEFHPFLAKTPNIEQPAAVVFDLDPGEGVNVIGAGRVSLLLRDLLAQLGLQSFAKVSGVKGVQVYVPLNTPATYSITQPFAKTVAELLHDRHPDLVVSEMARSERTGRVFIDWSQNADYKTTISVYSLRAKRHRPHVSMPVTWDELADAVEADDSSRLYWMADAALERLNDVGDLFAPVLKLKQTLPEPFMREVTKGADTLQKSARRTRAAPAVRASEQGGRRTFTLMADVLAIAIGDQRYAFRIEGKIPERTKQTARAVRLDEHPRSRNTAAPSDSGTVELIEGNAAKGYLYLYFDGQRWRGDYTILREQGNVWAFAKGFVAWSSPPTAKTRAKTFTIATRGRSR
jgi:bifunctional non-homologous end joining protein LigD